MKGNARLKDIARVAGVSEATVSRVWNHPNKVRPATRRRVLNAQRELGAGAPATETIGLIVPDASNPFFSQLILLFERELARFGAQLVSASSDGRLDREVELIDRFRAMRVSGIFYTPTRSDGEAVLQLVSRGDIPVLAFDRNVTVGNLDCVTTVSRKAVQTLVDYLLNHGHTRLGYIAGAAGTETAAERLESFDLALRRNGIPLESTWIVRGDYRAHSGRDAAEAFLALPEATRPTAVCAANDVMAVGFMQRVLQEGLRVPIDVSVAGYDGIDQGRWYHPSLTTIVQPVPQLVYEATKLLLERVEAHRKDEALDQRIVEVEPELAFRDSVGPAPSRGAEPLRLISLENANGRETSV